MEIIEETNINDIQEGQNYLNARTINDSYVESQIPSFNYNDLKQMYDNVSSLEKAVEEGDKSFVLDFLKYYKKLIKKATYNENDPYEYIEFMLPYIYGLAQVDTCDEFLQPILLIVYRIVNDSHYYSLKFANSSIIQQLFSIIKAGITDEITCISINIVYALSLYDELYDISFSAFPIQILFENLSKDLGDLIKDGIVNLICIHILHTSDDQKLYEIFSFILQYIIGYKSIDVVVIDLIAIIGRFFYRNKEKGVDILPEGLIEFLSNHLLEIITKMDEGVEDDIFYLLLHLCINKFEINYNAEDLYQLILNEKTNIKRKEKVISTISNAINVKNDIEYSKKFITKSIGEVINYAFEDGTVKCKEAGSVLLGAVLATDNYELFISILKSTAFNNFICYIENIDNEEMVIFGIGILGSALHYLKTTMPNSDEIKLFLNNILSSDLPDHMSEFADHPLLCEVSEEFCSLISDEAARLSMFTE